MKTLHNRRYLSPNFALLNEYYSFSLIRIPNNFIIIASHIPPSMQLTSLNRNTINQVEIALIASYIPTTNGCDSVKMQLKLRTMEFVCLQ